MEHPGRQRAPPQLGKSASAEREANGNVSAVVCRLHLLSPLEVADVY